MLFEVKSIALLAIVYIDSSACVHFVVSPAENSAIIPLQCMVFLKRFNRFYVLLNFLPEELISEIYIVFV